MPAGRPGVPVRDRQGLKRAIVRPNCAGAPCSDAAVIDGVWDDRASVRPYTAGSRSPRHCDGQAAQGTREPIGSDEESRFPNASSRFGTGSGGCGLAFYRSSGDKVPSRCRTNVATWIGGAQEQRVDTRGAWRAGRCDVVLPDLGRLHGSHSRSVAKPTRDIGCERGNKVGHARRPRCSVCLDGRRGPTVVLLHSS